MMRGRSGLQWACVALAAALLVCIAQPSSAQAPSTDPWQIFGAELVSVSAGGTAAATALRGVINNTYSLPYQQARRGQVYTGPNRRLRNVISKLSGKNNVTVVVIGGSTSGSSGASAPGTTDYVSLFQKYLYSAFPNATINFRRAAYGSCTAALANLCLPRFLNVSGPGATPVDLILSEFATDEVLTAPDAGGIINNTALEVYERLLRKLLKAPGGPAIVLVQTLATGQGYPPSGLAGSPQRPFHHTLEDGAAQLAQYYDMPWVSFRNAVWSLAGYGSNWPAFMSSDYIHPNDAGHKILSDMLVYLFTRTAFDLVLHPIGALDSAVKATASQLSGSMYPNNPDGPTLGCYSGREVQQLVAATTGWQVVSSVDTPPKYGYGTATPGSELTLLVNTTGDNGAQVNVVFGYLTGNTGLGQATVSCFGSCFCADAVMDGYADVPNPVVVLVSVSPSAAPNCTLSVVSSTGTNGGTNFKITDVMLVEESNPYVNVPVAEEQFLLWLNGQ